MITKQTLITAWRRTKASLLRKPTTKEVFQATSTMILLFYLYTFDLFITLPLVLINISFILVSMLRDR